LAEADGGFSGLSSESGPENFGKQHARKPGRAKSASSKPGAALKCHNIYIFQWFTWRQIVSAAWQNWDGIRHRCTPTCLAWAL
jgi:hypothetical protein